MFEVPQGAEGCYVPIAVVAGPTNFSTKAVPDEGTLSNTGTIAVSMAGSVCQDPLGLSGAELTALQAKHGGKIGAFLFSYPQSSGTGAFVQSRLLSLLRSTGVCAARHCPDRRLRGGIRQTQGRRNGVEQFMSFACGHPPHLDRRTSAERSGCPAKFLTNCHRSSFRGGSAWGH